ncbi:unnamed protein product [Heterobilharzia americana]|nr:unnamed protein product [Heterobilharzia americana]
MGTVKPNYKEGKKRKPIANYIMKTPLGKVSHQVNKHFLAYTKDDELIPKYSSIVVRRIPRLVTETQKKKVVGPDDLTWRELLKSQSNTSDTPNSSKHVNLADSDLPEEEKIKLMMERSSEIYSETNFTVRAKPYGVPPAAYVCHKCNQPGHWIHNCPGVRDKTGKIMDAKSVKRPTGIPQDFLLEVAAGTPGAYLGKSGKYMVPIKDAEAYAQGKKDKRPFSVEENPPYVSQERTPPKQLICPLCNKLFSDAVLVSCCGTTYCNECIMGHVFDSQVLGSHKCPNCEAVLTDHESSIFENALVRSLIRDWLADETKVVEQDLLIPEDIAKINENEKAFVNCRRVLKPKKAIAGLTSVKSANTNVTESSQIQNPMNTQAIASESTSVVKKEHLSLNPSSQISQTTNSVTLSNSSTVSSFDSVRVSELTNSSVITNNTNATVVTTSYGSLVGDPDWTAETALAASAAQSTGLLDPVLQVNNNQVAFGLVPGQSVTDTMHTALSAPVETLNGHKMLSKEEFYRLKMEVLHSARRRHRHRTRSRSPGYAYRTERLHGDTSRHRLGFEREDREKRRHHSPIDYEVDRSRYRHRHDDDYESHRDRSGTYRHHYRSAFMRDFDDDRRRYCSRSHLRSPERRSRRSPRHSPSPKDGLYGYKGRGGTLSPVSHEFADPRRYREPHISGDYNEFPARRNRSRSPVSVVPQYDVSDGESIGPRNPSLPRDSSQMQYVKAGQRQEFEGFDHVSCNATCDILPVDSAKQSVSLGLTNEIIPIDECLVGHSVDSNVISGETLAPQVKKVKTKKEKKHKKHKHKHFDKRACIQISGDSTNEVCIPTSDPFSCPDFELSDKKHSKKHKKQKKHKHGNKEKRKKETIDVDSSLQHINVDTADVNDLS